MRPPSYHVCPWPDPPAASPRQGALGVPWDEKMLIARVPWTRGGGYKDTPMLLGPVLGCLEKDVETP